MRQNQNDKKKKLKSIEKSANSGNPKKKSQKKLILVIVFVIFLLFGIILRIVTYPAYQEVKEQAFDGLSVMDKSTFMGRGNTRIYDKDGNLVGRLGNEMFEYVSISDVPLVLSKGYVAVEDQNFYTHHGVDYKGTLRAMLSYVTNGFRFTQGGSTITQQVVKNNLLSQEKSLKRKLAEAEIAFAMERKYTKAEIMEFYLNSSYYGNNCYGVQSASQYYFGKNVSDLTIGECAMLIGISNSPNVNNPKVDYDRCIRKRNQILLQMQDRNVITSEERDKAMEEEPDIICKKENVEIENWVTSYAIHCAVLKIMEKNQFHFQYLFDTEEEEENYRASYKKEYSRISSEIRSGGYTIHTSIDSEMQKQLQKAIDEELGGFAEKQADGRYAMQGAGICIDNKTGLVKAVVGGRSYEDGIDYYNRAFLAVRQPGSLIKPILDYGPALESACITPGTVFKDEKITIEGYSPKNENEKYYGNVTMREALAMSINTIALKVYAENGAEENFSYLDTLKFKNISFADKTNLSVSLGGFVNGCTPEEMAYAYACIANVGQFYDETCLVKLANRESVIYEADRNKHSVYSEETAFILTDMMESVLEEGYGTAHRIQNGEVRYAGKTGTTNGNKDAWFAGYSTSYTTCVWCGYDIPKSVESLHGNTYPASIFSRFMNAIHQEADKEEFSIPSSVILIKGDETRTPESSKYGLALDGYDYCSARLLHETQDVAYNRTLEEWKTQAESVVSDFEIFICDSIQSAKELDERYQSAKELVDQVPDSDVRKTFLYRLSSHYKLEQKNQEKWYDAEEKRANNEKEIKKQEAVIASQKSAEKAASEYEKSLKDLADWYIEKIKACTVYTSSTEKLISDGEKAVSNCSVLKEYQAIRSAFDAAVAQAKQLPIYENRIPETIPDEDSYQEDTEDSSYVITY